jgi:hypothetical protein
MYTISYILVYFRQRATLKPQELKIEKVFAALIIGLGAIFASFYYHEYGHLLNTALGRLDAVTAALEFSVLAIGLLCMLLKEPAVVVWMLLGTVILMAQRPGPNRNGFARYRARHLSGRVPRFGCATETGRAISRTGKALRSP